MNIKKELETKAGIANGIFLNDIEVDPFTIKAIMINEVVPSDPLQGFYGVPDADYLKTTIPLLQGAGAEVDSIQDILQMGIYITNAVKIPKTEYAKKAFNMITKKSTKKNVIPAVSTYKLRSSEIYYGDIRVMPSYIMTGGNILIEKSKVTMATEDIATMLEIIK